MPDTPPRRIRVKTKKTKVRKRLARTDYPPLPHLLFDLTIGLLWRIATRRTLSPFAMRRWFRLRDTFRRHGMPMDLFRNIEYTFTLANLPPLEGKRLLDAGSGDTPFVAHLLAQNPGLHVTINEIDPEAIQAQQTYIAGQNTPEDQYQIVSENLAQKPLGEGGVPFNYCSIVSTIEHFPANGDIEFLKGIWPHIQMGGTVVITVPASDHYEERSSAHYHGIFERRYDAKALYVRLQQNGYRMRHVRYLRHGSSLTARRLAQRYGGNLNNFFGQWYRLSERGQYSYEFVALLSLLLVDLSPVPTRDMIGAMLVMEKEPRRALDALDNIPLQQAINVGELCESSAEKRARVYCPMLKGEMEPKEYGVFPLMIFNYSDEPIYTDSNGIAPWHIGVSMEDLDRNEEIWDYAHLPLVHRIEPGQGIFFPIDVPIPEGRKNIRFVFDLVKEGQYWQRIMGGKAAWTEVEIREKR